MNTNIRNINSKVWAMFKLLCAESDISCNRQVKKLIREWVNRQLKRKNIRLKVKGDLEDDVPAEGEVCT